MVRGEQPGAFGYGHQRSEIVEQVHKKENKDDLQKTRVERPANIKFEGGEGQRVKAAGSGSPVGQPERPCDTGDGKYSDENGGADLSHFQSDHQDESAQRQRGSWVADIAQRDQGLGVANHQPSVAEADESDEQADAGGHRGV